MPAFFLTLLACLLVTAASREQLRVARLSAALGAGTGLFVAIGLSSIVTSAVAAWAGWLIAPSMAGAAKQMFVALALILGAVELAFLRSGPVPKEPTRSVGAIALVLFFKQLTDASRFLVLGFSVVTGDPYLAAAGGALGSGAALCIAVMAGAEWEARVPVRKLALGLAAVLFVAAIFTGLSARGILG